jgi:hypothetical protein
LYLKMEQRSYWNQSLLAFLGLDQDIFLTQLLSRYNEVKTDKLAIILKHYTKETFDIIRDLYIEDIMTFDYAEDVFLLEEILKHKALIFK